MAIAFFAVGLTQTATENGSPLRRGMELFREGPDVVRRHRAHLAEGLGDDQLRVQVAQDPVIELVDRLAAPDALADLAVDRGGSKVLGDRRAGELGQLLGLWRIIALVSDRDHVVAEPEGEQRLGRGRDQAGYAHGGHDGTSRG